MICQSRVHLVKVRKWRMMEPKRQLQRSSHSIDLVSSITWSRLPLANTGRKARKDKQQTHNPVDLSLLFPSANSHQAMFHYLHFRRVLAKTQVLAFPDLKCLLTNVWLPGHSSFDRKYLETTSEHLQFWILPVIVKYSSQQTLLARNEVDKLTFIQKSRHIDDNKILKEFMKKIFDRMIFK